jgi:hypothetical protein
VGDRRRFVLHARRRRVCGSRSARRRNTDPECWAGREITLREEEVADVSLATFYVFDPGGGGVGLARRAACRRLRQSRLRLDLLHVLRIRRRRSPAGQAQILGAQACQKKINTESAVAHQRPGVKVRDADTT